MIGAFFREIDRADELGSGMRNLMLYGKKYGGADPQLIEGDIFQMVISVPEFAAGPGSADAKAEAKPAGWVEGLAERWVEGLVESQRAILRLVVENPSISKKAMASRVGISSTAVDKNIKTLKEKGLLMRIGPAKGGHWEVDQRD